MKKRFISFAVFVALSLSCVSVAFAGFGGGSRGGSFGTGGFGGGTSDTVISFQTLSDFCIDINADIIAGVYNSYEPFKSHGTSIVAFIDVYSSSDNPSRYVIKCVYGSTTYYFKNQSGGMVYAYSDKDNDHTGKPFYTLLNSINTKLSNIYTRLSTTNSNIQAVTSAINSVGTYLDNVEGYIDQIEGYLLAQATTFSNIYTRIGVTNTEISDVFNQLRYTDADGVTDSVASFLYKIYLRLGVTNTELSDIYTKLNDLKITQNNNSSHITFITGIATATADIDVKMGSLIDDLNLNFDDLIGNLDLNFDDVIDKLDIGFDDVVGAIEGSSTDVSSLVPYVDQLEQYTDGLEETLSSIRDALITTVANRKVTIINKLDLFNLYLEEIHNWLTSQEVSSVQLVSDMMSDWGFYLSDSLLNSSHVLSLFDKAFGGIPNDFDLSRAGAFFDYMYEDGGQSGWGEL